MTGEYFDERFVQHAVVEDALLTFVMLRTCLDWLLLQHCGECHPIGVWIHYWPQGCFYS